MKGSHELWNQRRPRSAYVFADGTVVWVDAREEVPETPCVVDRCCHVWPALKSKPLVSRLESFCAG